MDVCRQALVLTKMGQKRGADGPLRSPFSKRGRVVFGRDAGRAVRDPAERRALQYPALRWRQASLEFLRKERLEVSHAGLTGDFSRLGRTPCLTEVARDRGNSLGIDPAVSGKARSVVAGRAG